MPSFWKARTNQFSPGSPGFYYRLVTPTSNVTLAGATTTSNKTFNTNVPVTLAMVIRRIVVIQAMKVAPDQGTEINQFLWELTEDPTKTTVAQTDPFALADGGWEVMNEQVTAAGEIFLQSDIIRRVYDYLPPHPGVPTVAQQLNLVTTGIRVVGTSVQGYDTFLQIYYELATLSESIKTFLTNRIALQRTT